MHHELTELLRSLTADPAATTSLLDAASELFAQREDSRLEQWGLPAAAHALPGRPRAMAEVLAGARELLGEGFDAGWFVQEVVPPLATAMPDDTEFAVHWRGLLGFAQRVNRGGVHVGSPLATGLAALLERADAAAMPRWLAVLEVPSAPLSPPSGVGLPRSVLGGAQAPPARGFESPSLLDDEIGALGWGVSRRWFGAG